MSMSSYCVSLMREDRRSSHPGVPLALLPPLVHLRVAASGVREPKDSPARDRRARVPDDRAVWIRGILHDEYGVDPASCEY